ncbi:PREDICTED: glutamate receptor 2.2-like [Nelumbo nucifera]|uniref:Glutamate receptor n=2 Tax=Nelumbo nucifera TaxID=4432 RepID=A0A1U7ZQJ5_NELNU|nr:PREDICTED: glutamate receptor 2.2-like [Nelumbo nucifera]DAD19312.1 TPA_asm: hypothetical protein HUJ06_020775 [Nelumbo nucifera]
MTSVAEALPLFLFVYSLMGRFCPQLAEAQGSRGDGDTLVQFHVGVVLDMETLVGKISNSSISMAVTDFYDSHSDYKTRLVLHTRDSNQDVVAAAIAAIDLLQKTEVQAIVGPQTSQQAEFIVDLGNRVKVPIISFCATSPSLCSRTPYFIRTIPDDHTQVQGIASLAQAFRWRKVIPILEDADYGNQLTSDLIHALQEVNTRVPYRSVISPSATDEQILEELMKLMKMQTSVFVVHMPLSLGSRLFLKAKEIGMMSEGYAWIITNELTNVLGNMDSSVINSMQGVLGITPYIPQSDKLTSFIERWKGKFLEENQDIESANMNTFALWAYDTIWALAMAVERVQNMTPHNLKPTFDETSTDLLSLKISIIGSKLLKEIQNIKLKGLTGDFHLINGQLQPSAFQILNVVGKGSKEVGFWTVKHGFSKDLNEDDKIICSLTDDSLQGIIWPGESINAPKGWMIPKSKKKLRIGVPVTAEGFSEFVKVEQDPSTKLTNVSGYCIDVFNSVMASLPYNIPYEFVPFQNEDGKSAGSYNDLIYQVYTEEYDAVVGDITITANRSLYVDFALPYTDGGVWMVVPNKSQQRKDNNVWIEPLSWDFLSSRIAFFIFTGFVIWVSKHQGHNSFKGHMIQHDRTFLHSLSAPLTHRKNILVGIFSKLLVMMWLFTIIILTSSYIASLTSIFMVKKLQPIRIELEDLIRNGDYVGYRKGSFIEDLLKRSKFAESKLKAYSTLEECNEALSKGSQNGGVSAFFDELPYIYTFRGKYCSKYEIIGPTHKTDGFGFAFPRGSPLVADISKALLYITEGQKMMKIEQSWFGRRIICEDANPKIIQNPFIVVIDVVLMFFLMMFLIIYFSGAKEFDLCWITKFLWWVLQKRKEK